MEIKKMILSHLFSAVSVSRDYRIEIDLTVDCEQLGIDVAGFTGADFVEEKTA